MQDGVSLGQSPFCISDRGGEFNEDFVSCKSKFGVLLDGASGLGQQYCRFDGFSSEAQWFSYTLGTALVNRLSLTRIDLRNVVSAALKDVSANFASVEACDSDGALGVPSATICIAALDERILHLCWLGDSPLVIVRDNSVELLRDNSVTRFDQVALQEMSIRTRGRNLNGSQKRSLVEDMLISNRSLMNRGDGYWILDALGRGADHMYCRDVVTDGIFAVLGMSDGMFCAFDNYGLCDLESFCRTVSYDDTREMINFMRGVEAEDPDFDRFPRFKLSDDASMFYLPVASGII